MQLLQWCTVKPAGSSDIAAIRFSSAVHVRSIRIFPSNAVPFASSPDIIARTEPEAFFLNVFLNAQPTAHNDANKKYKSSNALIPTTIAYPGGQVEFKVNMGLEFASRLMILKGNFVSVSLAIYGDIASEPAPPMLPEPKEFPSVEPTPLPRSLDPSNCLDPTSLAHQLLTLVDDAPPLPLLIRLMFCLKPSNDDWENPDFPHLYADMDYAADAENFDLQEAYAVTGRPMAEDASEESITRFADKIANCIDSKNDDQTYLVAGVLSRAASQGPSLARALLEKIELEPLVDASHLDSGVLQRFLTASTNPIIACHLNRPWFFQLIQDVLSNPSVDGTTKSIARKLEARIHGWPVLEDALSNTQADFRVATKLLYDIGSEEQSFGVWLACEVTHPDLRTKLMENSVIPFPLVHPPALLRSEGVAAGASHDEFIAFLRAYLGVACVLAVFAWSDSLGSKVCRERTLAIIRLWQEVDGYREIVNHLLLLRQMIFRLECNLDNDPPTSSGISTENILVSLVSSNPASMLSPDMIKCSLNLQQPLSYITETERIVLRRLAITAEDGLPAAVEVLGQKYDSPMKMEDINSMRVSLKIVETELNDGLAGEHRTLEALWGEGRHGLVLLVVEVFTAITSDIRSYFVLNPPPAMGQRLLAELFETARDVLKLIARLIPAYPLSSRPTCTLVADIADLFVCTDAADMLYSQSNPACLAAQSSRQVCIDAVRTLCLPSEDSSVARHDGKSNGYLVFRTLLEHGLRCGDMDPACHIQQVFSLIDHLLPSSACPEDEEQALRLREVVPNVLVELKTFFRALDADNRVHFTKRLANLDSGVLGVGEWLVLEELRYLDKMIRELRNDATGSNAQQRSQFAEYQVSLSLKFVCDLVSAANSAPWGLKYVATDADAVGLLQSCLALLVEKCLWSGSLIGIALSVSAHWTSGFDQALGVIVVLILFRDRDVSLKNQELTLELVWSVLQYVNGKTIDLSRVRGEFSRWLARVLGRKRQESQQVLEETTAESMLVIVEWLLQNLPPNDTMLHLNLSANHFSVLSEQLEAVIPQNKRDSVGAMFAKISASGNENVVTSLSISDNLRLSIHDLEELLEDRMDVDIPSTPPQRPVAHTQDVFGLVTVSPPTALLRSPAATGLTKTYANNDFRQLRQTSSARQNTSRLPSMHVDEFELAASSPTLMPIAIPSELTMPMPMAADLSQTLSPAFNTQ